MASGEKTERIKGCWDHSCPYRTDPKPRVGTNGGCHCNDCDECGGHFSRMTGQHHRAHCSKRLPPPETA